MVWSASHACVCSDNRPVRTTAASASATLTAAPSRGWPAVPRPADTTSAVCVEDSSQYRRRWKAYVGNST